MKTHINIATLREQISKKINNYQKTIEGISKGKDNTEWHNKQIKILESRVTELEWALTLIPEPKPFCLAGTIDDGIEEKFLEDKGTFQRDKNGVFSYISDNEMHISNLVALLEDYREHLVALSKSEAYPTKSYAMYEEELNKIGRLSQAQFAKDRQLSILLEFANKLGLYDAADFIKNC